METEIIHCKELNTLNNLELFVAKRSKIHVAIYTGALAHFKVAKYRFLKETSFYLLTETHLFWKGYGETELTLLNGTMDSAGNLTQITEYLEKKIKKVPQVGDLVVTTYSRFNWANDMTSVSNKLVSVTEVYGYDAIRFNGGEGYSWLQSDLHFRPAFKEDFKRKDQEYNLECPKAETFELTSGKYVFYTSVLHKVTAPDLKSIAKNYAIDLYGWAIDVLKQGNVKGIVVHPFFENGNLFIGKGIVEGINEAKVRNLKIAVLYREKLFQLEDVIMIPGSRDWAKLSTITLGEEIAMVQSEKDNFVRLTEEDEMVEMEFTDNMKPVKSLLIHAYKKLKLV